MREISSVFKMFFEAGEQQLTRLAGQLMSNEAFVSALQGALTRATDAKLLLDNQLRTALSRLGVPTREEVEALQKEVGELRAQVRRLQEEAAPLHTPAQAARAKPALTLAAPPEKPYPKVSLS